MENIKKMKESIGLFVGLEKISDEVESLKNETKDILNGMKNYSFLHVLTGDLETISNKIDEIETILRNMDSKIHRIL